MIRAAVIFVVLFSVFFFIAERSAEHTAAAPANTETLTCVRVKEVTPAGTINYLCEVRK